MVPKNPAVCVAYTCERDVADASNDNGDGNSFVQYCIDSNLPTQQRNHVHPPTTTDTNLRKNTLIDLNQR